MNPPTSPTPSPMLSPSTQALAEATRRRRENAENAVTRALRHARQNSAPITVTGIAAAAGVSTDFIYRHGELRAQVEALRRTRPTAPTTPTDRADKADIEAADSTLIRRLGQQLTEARRRHRDEVTELRRALEAAHGELLHLRRQLNDSADR